MGNTPTPHIKAEPGDFARVVLMPGDPKRSEFIARNYLDSPRLVNDVRGVHGYTGTFEGIPVSVMASGMGMPSIGIYSYELFNFYGVDAIIRVGSAGSLQKDVQIMDLVLAQGASTNSNYASQFGCPGTFAPIADFEMLKKAESECRNLGINYHVGNVLSSDTFYSDDVTANEKWAKMGVLCVEMEAASLYMNAARAKKKALAILTISDSIVTGESTTSETRETKLKQMVEVALKTAKTL
jgi:purine-nucleoside phosphorylase